MATITLNENWRLQSDSLSWMVQKKITFKTGKKAGESEWTTQTWHKSISDAAKAYKERALRDCDAETMAELLEVAKIVESEVKCAVETA